MDVRVVYKTGYADLDQWAAGIFSGLEFEGFGGYLGRFYVELKLYGEVEVLHEDTDPCEVLIQDLADGRCRLTLIESATATATATFSGPSATGSAT